MRSRWHSADCCTRIGGGDHDLLESRDFIRACRGESITRSTPSAGDLEVRARHRQAHMLTGYIRWPTTLVAIILATLIVGASLLIRVPTTFTVSVIR
jgi:hypothetical protein